MKKRIVLVLAAAGLVVATAIAVHFYLRGQAGAPKRVWVAYSEKYRDAAPRRTQDYEQDADDKLLAEVRLGWRISRDKSCIVLTRNRQTADYIVTISVVRLDGEIFGEASLSNTKANGDVMLVDRFYQDRHSREDIAQQSVTAAWQFLCQNPSR